MIELKTAKEIDKMAVTGEFVGRTLAALARDAQPGVNLMALEHRARALIADRGAASCYWDYAPSFGRGPFRNVICLSVNDGVLHGLPRDYVLRDGDVLTTGLRGVDRRVGRRLRRHGRRGRCADDSGHVVGRVDPTSAGRRYRGRGSRAAASATFPAAIGDVAAAEGYRGQHRLRRPRHRPNHARGPPRPEPRPARTWAGAAARNGSGARAVVGTRHE